MKVLLLIIVGLIAISFVASLVGPLIVVAIGGTLLYYAFKHLSRKGLSVLSVIWWVIVGALGFKLMIVNLPHVLFLVGGFALVYFLHKRSNGGFSRQSGALEASWRDLG